MWNGNFNRQIVSDFPEGSILEVLKRGALQPTRRSIPYTSEATRKSVFNMRVTDGMLRLRWGPFGNGRYTVQWTDHPANSWQNVPGTWPRTATYWTGDANTGIGTRYYRVMSGSQ